APPAPPAVPPAPAAPRAGPPPRRLTLLPPDPVAIPPCRVWPGDQAPETEERRMGDLHAAQDDTARRLERGEVIFYPRAPFPLPDEAGRAFLLGVRLGRVGAEDSRRHPSHRPAAR